MNAKRRAVRSMSRVLLLLPMTCLMALAVSVPAASAQSMDRIAANLNNGGVYVESGADGSAADFLRPAASI
jgi:hypothetical protein